MMSFIEYMLQAVASNCLRNKNSEAVGSPLTSCVVLYM